MINFSIIDRTVEALFSKIEFSKTPEGLYDPLRYMMEIGGKRLRPKLCLATYSIYRDYFKEEILEPARALEVFHTFTLIHDDIMDKSPMRRGMPTVWKKWKEDTAILSGDVMLIDAYKRIAKAPVECLTHVLDLFSKTASEVCEGQQMDMDFEDSESVSMDEYEKMIGFKTAVLFACSAKMGALIAEADDDECEALYTYGHRLGMAFQIADDYLDTFGDKAVFGKPIGGDIIQNKKTWLLTAAFAKTGDRGRLLEYMNLPSDTEEQKEAKIDRVRQVYRDLDVDKDARCQIGRFTRSAVEALKDTYIRKSDVRELAAFADMLVGRQK